MYQTDLEVKYSDAYGELCTCITHGFLLNQNYCHCT